MEYNKWIADFQTGDEVEGFYVLKTAASKVSNSGKPFLSASLADRSGAIETKMWLFRNAAFYIQELRSNS